MNFLDIVKQRHPEATNPGVIELQADIAPDPSDPFLFTATITNSSLDRDNEVLLPQGMIANEFERSGAVFWNHDYDRPVAVPLKLRSATGAIEGKARFLSRPGDFKGEFFPDFVRAFVNQMKQHGKGAGVSIGFVPVETRNPTKRDREIYGSDVERVHSKWKLLEWSVAPVQANAEAIVTAVGKAAIPKKVASRMFPGVPIPEAASKAVSPRRVVVVPFGRSRRDRRPQEVKSLIERAIAKKMGKIYWP